MEVRTIKTCQGVQEIQFLDNALLPAGERIEAHETNELSQTDYEALNQLIAELYRADRPQRKIPQEWLKSNYKPRPDRQSTQQAPTD
jgi:hypothetical protein